ncbi:Uncharacterised protein [Yersinia similis]|uniref:Uncharacterized protein n=1 Tax=Yersinia wautersii TaxID=1341643 RepID=A0ABM9TGG3_9GAMM|nr:Uncharacterised protein [Yersinia similis]CNG25789.1 Uncharacterised protein [Yersinia pseudotuberculosis]CRG50816.1 Uncharacterised protein [Yersinia wautersii]CNB63385.1 Uncharacterised protein [Yersinia similis]CNF69581.1 Uncharacterised protein [Yersinia similis]
MFVFIIIVFLVKYKIINSCEMYHLKFNIPVVENPVKCYFNLLLAFITKNTFSSLASWNQPISPPLLEDRLKTNLSSEISFAQ